MTSDQLKIIQSLTQQERVAKYNKRLFLHPNDPLKITPNQLRQILELPYTGSVQAESHDQNQTSEQVGISLSPDKLAEGDNVTGDSLTKAFGGYIVHEEPEAKSQKARILKVLEDYQPHTVGEIFDKVYGVGHKGYGNVHGRITDLRKDGHNIPDAQKNEKGEWCYQIINQEKLL